MSNVIEPSQAIGPQETMRRNRDKRRGILIHGMNFYPELIGVGKYCGELAFSLARNGHRVEVVSAQPHYPGWNVPAPYKAWRYQADHVNGVSVLRCPLLTRSGSGLWRALAPLSFAMSGAPAVVWRILRSRPATVMCVEPTLFSAPAALLAGKLVGARTVLHVQDLEIDAAFEVGHLRGDRLRRLATWLESTLLRRFDLVVTISLQMRQALVRKGSHPSNTIVLRNWIDLNAIRPLPAAEPNAYRQALGLTPETFVVLYSGHIGKKQALDVLLDAAAQCADHHRLHFVIAGDGPVKDELVSRYGHLTRVSFLPLQPAERLNELLNLPDLHVLPQSRAAADLVLPSKLGGILASGRPLIATIDPDTELARLLEGVALSVPPEDPPALAQAIIRASTQDLRPLAERGLSLAFSLSSKQILKRFEEALVGSMPRFSEAQELLAGDLRRGDAS